MKKALHAGPKRLQRMLLRLQKYNLQVEYRQGKMMFLAVTLSRAYLSQVNACIFAGELEEADHRETLPVSGVRWEQITMASAEDPVMQQLCTTIQSG